MPQEYAPILFGALLAFPIVWYFTRNKAITT
jgi:hypothetical protein